MNTEAAAAAFTAMRLGAPGVALHSQEMDRQTFGGVPGAPSGPGVRSLSHRPAPSRWRIAAGGLSDHAGA